MTDILNRLGAGEALRRLRDGTLSSEELALACLEAIESREPSVCAFAFRDDRAFLAAARAADKVPPQRRGPLHGLPVGVKDVIDSVDLPTEYGCLAWNGHRPAANARCLDNVLSAGALLIGKTVTTEYALLEPSRTRNPLDSERTPGGSSAGSAAAVAAGMIPVALGTQTNASTIRPASYCGVYGYKPTFGVIPTGGVACIAPSLDAVGFFSRDVEGLAQLAEQAANGGADSPLAEGKLRSAVADCGTRRWRVGIVRTAWDSLDPWVPTELERFFSALGRRAVLRELGLPETFDEIYRQHMVIQDAGVAAALVTRHDCCPTHFSDSLRRNIDRGRRIARDHVERAQAFQSDMRVVIDELFAQVDVIVTAAATGEAPAPDTTGHPIMSTPWTFAGTPALSAPLFRGPNGMPLGLQVIARRGSDAAVFAFAASLDHET